MVHETDEEEREKKELDEVAWVYRSRGAEWERPGSGSRRIS